MDNLKHNWPRISLFSQAVFSCKQDADKCGRDLCAPSSPWISWDARFSDHKIKTITAPCPYFMIFTTASAVTGFKPGFMVKHYNKSTCCEQPPDFVPITVMDGLSLPSSENMQGISNLAKGLFGLGSFGVPSTLDHTPMVLRQPTMLCKIQQWGWGDKRTRHGISLFCSSKHISLRTFLL